MNYLILTENDESAWDDNTGISYHFPYKYRSVILEGSEIIYYKSKIKNKNFKGNRLSEGQHYFGVASIGAVKNHPNGKSLVAEIENYKGFEKAILFKDSNGYLEVVPESKSGNYWRDGVRQITKENFDKILSLAKLSSGKYKNPIESYTTFHSNQIKEGSKKVFYSVKYERSKINRDQAIKIHGFNCKVCDFNFRKVYGDIGEGFIHVHHIKPLYELDEEVIINPSTDLVPVCPNCHAMIHRFKDKVFTIDELKILMSKINFK